MLEISNGTKSFEYKKGERIFSQGDVANKLYLISSGKIKVFRYTPEGKEIILYILSPKCFSFIGAFNLLKEDKFDFHAEIIEDSVICTLDKKDFDQIIIKNPNITLKILEEAYDRIVKLETLVDRLNTSNVESKVANLLLSLMRDFGTETSEGTMLNMTLNREELGSYAGLTRETISRKLRLFHEQDIINLIGSKKILVKDIKKLKELI